MAKQTAKNAKSLQESLAESLKQAVPIASETPEPEHTPPNSLKESSAPLKATPQPAAVDENAVLVRTSVTMKATELGLVEQILDVLKGCRRHRGGLTEAINIALRLCPLDSTLIGQAWDEYRLTDLRVNKRKRIK